MCLGEGSPPLPHHYWLTASLIALIHEIKKLKLENKDRRIKVKIKNGEGSPPLPDHYRLGAPLIAASHEITK